jgi:hypothetical protein
MRPSLSTLSRIAAGAVLVGTLATTTVACGGDDGGGGGGDANSELVDRLVNELDAPREEAECVVEALGDDVELLFTISEPGYEPTDEDLALLEEFTLAGEGCGIE